jgi:mono/diheme cytochrome c family protein
LDALEVSRGSGRQAIMPNARRGRQAMGLPSGEGMNRGVLNLLIDTVAAALLTALVGTGYLLWFVLPPGTHRTHILWGLLRHQWGAMHAWISLGLLAVLAVHVALHWRWLVMGLSKRFGVATWAARSPRLAGLTVLTAAALPLTTLVLAAHVSVRTMDPPLHPLEDDPRTRAAPTTPGTVAERAAPSSGASAPMAGPGARDAVTARAAAVLAARCAACHGTHEPAAGLRADTPGALGEAQGGIRWVTPGRPDESRLFEVVGVRSAAGRIAPKHRLSESEMEALRAWITSLPE